MHKQKTTVAPGDRFTRTFQFQEEKLQGRPGWWIELLHVMSRYASYQTGAYTGTYEGLQQALAKKRIYVAYGTIRNAIDQLQALGLLARDRTANITGRRLMVVLRLSVKQSATALMDAVAKLVSSRLSRFPQKEKPAAPDSANQQRYQIPSPKGSTEAPPCEKVTPEGKAIGLAAARALLAGFQRPRQA